jgi:hypothetical protein
MPLCYGSGVKSSEEFTIQIFYFVTQIPLLEIYIYEYLKHLEKSYKYKIDQR